MIGYGYTKSVQVAMASSYRHLGLGFVKMLLPKHRQLDYPLIFDVTT